MNSAATHSSGAVPFPGGTNDLVPCVVASVSPAAQSVFRKTAILFVGLLLAAHLWEIGNRGFDPDEFEHAHAAYCVWRGDLPYRDFFEHHAPGFYFLLQPAFWLCGPEIPVLWMGRGCALLCGWGSLLLLMRLAHRLKSNWQVGLSADAGSGGDPCITAAGGAGSNFSWMNWPLAAVCAATTIFHAKVLELRPDVPAMLLLLAGLWVAVGRSGSAEGAAVGCTGWRLLCSGLLCGLATVCTQKAIVPAAGIAFGLCAQKMLGASSAVPRAMCFLLLARTVLCFGLGGALVWLVLFAGFATQGGGHDLWQSAVVQLVKWPVKSSRWENLRPTLAADATVWIAGLWELLWLVRHFRNRAVWQSGYAVVGTAVGVSLVGLAFVKAAYPQYYLLWFPWLVLLACERCGRWLRQSGKTRRITGFVLAGLGLFLMEAYLWRRASGSGVLPVQSVLWRAAVLGGACAFLLRIRGLVTRGQGALLAVLMLGLAYGQCRVQLLLQWSQQPQREAVLRVNRAAGETGTVLDGFTGYGVLRPHAYYFWWINEYSLALMTPRQREFELQETLQAQPPAVVLLDDHLRLLPADTVRWLETHYAPAEPPLWLPRETPPAFMGTSASSR